MIPGGAAPVADGRALSVSCPRSLNSLAFVDTMAPPGELWLCLIAEGRRRVVRVRADPSMDAAELARHLATHVGLAGEWELHSAWRGRLEGRLDRLGLRTGEEVRLSRPGEAVAIPSEWELVVAGGPLAGRRFPLPAGGLAVGRSARAHVRLADRALAPLHLQLRVDADGVVASDLNGPRRTYLEGRPLVEHRLEPGDVLEAGRSLLRVQRCEPEVPPVPLAVVRRPAAPAPLPPLPALPAPPERHRPARLPVAASLAPMLLGLAAWMASRNAATLLFALGSPLLALAPPLEERLARRWQERVEGRRFRRRLAAAAAALEAARRHRARAARAASPDLCELEDRALRDAVGLWQRDRDHGFLFLRVGWADLPDEAPALPKGGEGHLRRELEAVAAPGRLPAVPLVLDLGRRPLVGLTGPRTWVEGVARGLLVQAAALHPPSELGLVAFVPRARGWEWLRWLPHRVHLAAGPERQRSLAARLPELAAAGPLLVLVHEAAVGSVPIFAPGDAGRGLHVLWLGSSPGRLPRGCQAILEVVAGGDRITLRGSQGEPERIGVPDVVDEDCAERVARALAGLREAGVGALPERAGLAACLGTADLIAAVPKWWAQAPDLAAPVGMAADGPLVLDLRRDGPHALVAGTSGSGKSELLRSWVAALAARHSPRRVNFLLVDFKGGTALRDCARLPHTVGLVTDLDEHSLARLELSLRAELKRREAALAAADEKEFADWERRDPKGAPAALVVVFDEFEQLLAEHPDFVSGLIVPMARVGRGLGVHLILGTQRPRGAVSEAIRSNTNLRIALRTLTEEGSRDVIDAPDAAHISPRARGRALVRLSHERLIPFQAAHATACSFSATPVVADLDLGPAAEGPTDFDRLLAAVEAAHRTCPVQVFRPWLEPLPERLELDLSASEPVLGLIDEPGRQARRELVWRPADGPLLCHGGAGGGKSSLLRTVALALAARRPPDQLHLYGLDPTGGLAGLEGLPHLGGRAGPGQEELAAALLRRLHRELGRRRRGAEGPEVVLLVDGVGEFEAAFERIEGGRYLELLEELLQAGRAFGIHCALATVRRRDLARPAWRLLLRPEAEDQEAVGLRGRARPAAPGRGLLVSGHEFQIAVPATDALVPELRARWAGRPGPVPLRTLPAVVEATNLPPPTARLGAVLGLGGEEVEAIEVDLEAGHLAVCGPRGSGRTSALAALAASLARAPASPRLLRPGPSDRVPQLRALAEQPPQRWTVLLLDDADRLPEEGGRLLEGLLADTDGCLRLVVAAQTRSLRAFAGWPAELRAARRLILLDPDPIADGELAGMVLPRPLRPQPGLGVLVLGRDAVPVQVGTAGRVDMDGHPEGA
jgi:S-DNA-T family DNA segregation ATPase FtsK/SpoIIIE